LVADIRAGLIVFFIALPLCLGIATASGAPPLAGIIAGIVGGIAVALVSGSPLSVAGPAAGLTVIVFEAIERLGFRAFLLATMLAGLIQMACGIAKLGKVGQFVPNAVIRGMLAAIGLILVLKQLPHAVGHDEDFVGDHAFQQADQHNTLSALVHSLGSLSAAATMIAVAAGLTLLLWKDYGRLRLTRFVPKELAAVLVGLIGTFMFAGTQLELAASHRVTLPLLSEVGGFAGLWVMPDFSAIGNLDVWKTAITLCIVASIETLLCIEAIDRIDPERRVSPPDRELIAQGTGNALAGLLGGLPLTSVVVRSFANVQAGGRTRTSSIVHGLLLIGALAALAPLLNQIPLAALAAILIMVGFKLTPPKLYYEAWRAGPDQFVPFIATVTFILFTDLLTGTFFGFGFALFFAMWRQYRSAIVVTDDGDYRMIRLVSNVSFLHKARLKGALATVAAGRHIVLDGTRATAIDADVIEILRELEQRGSVHGSTVSIRRSAASSVDFFREELAA
jgi:MFS superfamily sulfate permease-like transporter